MAKASMAEEDKPKKSAQSNDAGHFLHQLSDYSRALDLVAAHEARILQRQRARWERQAAAKGKAPTVTGRPVSESADDADEATVQAFAEVDEAKPDEQDEDAELVILRLSKRYVWWMGQSYRPQGRRVGGGVALLSAGCPGAEQPP